MAEDKEKRKSSARRRRITRREFLQASTLAAAAGGLTAAGCAPTPTPAPAAEAPAVDEEAAARIAELEAALEEAQASGEASEEQLAELEAELEEAVAAAAEPEVAVAVIEGDTPEERALNGIKALKEAGVIKDGDTFTIMHHSGQRNNIVPALEEWNELTGLNFQSAEIGLESDIYTEAMNESVVRTGDYAIFLTFCNWIGDMAEAGLIVDQTDWWAKYDPEVDHGPNAYVEPLDRFTSLYKGRRFALGADDDAFSLFYRKDIMEDPDEAKAFEDEYGRELELPKTWEEFDEWIAFFDRPEEDMRGAHMYAERYFAYTAWAARFVSKGGVYFDDNMDPLIVSDEGVTALEEQIRLTQNHMWPDAVTGDWAVAYSRFPEGSVFFAWAWASLGKWAQDPETSEIVGKVGFVDVPGTVHGDTLIRAAPHVVGWSFSVSKYGVAPEAAYCFIQWFTGPTVGLDAIARVGTLDVFRKPWFEEDKMKEAYGAEFMPVLLRLTENSFADLALRGAAEYLDNLNLNLQQAFAGQKDAEAALKDTADAWQETTDRIGRLGQAEAWREERKNYPQAIQDLWAQRGTF